MDDEPLAWVPAGHYAVNRSGLLWQIDEPGPCTTLLMFHDRSGRSSGSEVKLITGTIRSHSILPDQGGALYNHSSTSSQITPIQPPIPFFLPVTTGSIGNAVPLNGK